VLAVTDPGYELQRRAMITTIRSAAALPPPKRPGRAPPPSPPEARPVPRTDRRTFEVAGIVASLGGPPVVAEILSALEADHPPVLLVQHIEASFVEGFVAWLRTATRRDVRIAASGVKLERGVVHVPPADTHALARADGVIEVSRALAPVGGFRPSGTVLLRSLGEAFGRAALGIVLTGMGRDGSEGARKLRDAGGLVIAQEEASCVVASMPNAARDLGAVDLSLAPGAIAKYLV